MNESWKLNVIQNYYRRLIYILNCLSKASVMRISIPFDFLTEFPEFSIGIVYISDFLDWNNRRMFPYHMYPFQQKFRKFWLNTKRPQSPLWRNGKTSVVFYLNQGTWLY